MLRGLNFYSENTPLFRQNSAISQGKEGFAPPSPGSQMTVALGVKSRKYTYSGNTARSHLSQVQCT